MSRTLAGQLQYAVLKSARIGSSKHADRRAGESQYHAYSHATLQKRLEVAKALGKHIQAAYGVRMATDVKEEHIQGFLDSLARSGRTPHTLESTTSEARAICRAASQTFKAFKLDGSGVKTPRAQEGYVRTDRDPEGMLQADFDMIRGKAGDNNLGRGMDIARMTGARAYGCTHIRGTDIHEKDGKMTVTLTEKGGRTREVDIVRDEYKLALRHYAGRFGNDRVCPIKEKSLERALARAMKVNPMLKPYRYAKMHTVRKLWANERYAEYRQEHTKLETVQYINEQLGHGAERDEALLAHYVSDLS